MDTPALHRHRATNHLRNAAGFLGTVAVALALAGCPCGKPAPTEGIDAGSPLPPIPTSTACDSLDRADCIRATHCTLYLVDRAQYECRVAVGPCETGLIQTDRRECEKRAGCAFDPGVCYCPFPGYGRTKVPDPPNAGAACACGGGPPARCKAADPGTPVPRESAAPPSGSR